MTKDDVKELLEKIDEQIREKHKLLADERRKLNELTEQRITLLEKIK